VHLTKQGFQIFYSTNQINLLTLHYYFSPVWEFYLKKSATLVNSEALSYSLVIYILIKSQYTMAKPIKNTPVLEGKDAINFFAKLEENKSKKVDRAYLSALRESAKKLQAILRPQ
jgi:hypothetical protein